MGVKVIASPITLAALTKSKKKKRGRGELKGKEAVGKNEYHKEV
jgi:hypothetical protein